MLEEGNVYAMTSLWNLFLWSLFSFMQVPPSKSLTLLSQGFSTETLRDSDYSLSLQHTYFMPGRVLRSPQRARLGTAWQRPQGKEYVRGRGWGGRKATLSGT